MATEHEDRELRRRSEFMQALTTEHFALQGARSNTVSESAGRSSLYLTTLSSAVVAIALAAQASRFGDAFFIFALAILPVVFFLGLVTYGRLLQSGVEDVTYARAVDRIRRFYAEIDPSNAGYFRESSADGGIRAAGLFKLRWQQFLAAAAMVAMVNAMVGGAFVGLMAGHFLGPPEWAATAIGGGVTVLLAAAFLRHQWRAWSHLDVALPAG